MSPGMRLITIRDGSRDGSLGVVHSGGLHFAPAGAIARNLQDALDRWNETEPRLLELAAKLEAGSAPRETIDFAKVAAPLPRPYEWVDGSAFINHIVLVRKARGAEPPKTLLTDPLVYQGGTSEMRGCRDAIDVPNFEWGCDFESEVGVILGDTPRGTTAANAHGSVRLFVLLNDVTFRNLIPAELEKGFGFFQSKPATAFSPFAVTEDELGGAFREGRVHLPLVTHLNDTQVGDPDAGSEMHFSFFDLIAHITKTRAFAAGTIVGSGTVSNVDRARGISCLVERRMIEILDSGKPTTPYLKEGDRVRIDMTQDGRKIFGGIDQIVRGVS